MNEINDTINTELANLNFNHTPEEIRSLYKLRKSRKNRTIALFLCIVVGSSALAFNFYANNKTEPPIKHNQNAVETTIPQVENTFLISVCTSDKYSNNTNEHIINNEKVIIPNFNFDVSEFENNGKTYKTFSPNGSRLIGIKGEKIKNVCFKSAISTFRINSVSKSEITINYDENYNTSSVVEWLLPEKTTYFMEKQSEPDYIFKFSDIPKDTVTITVTFSDNVIQTKKLDLYFNNDGYLIVEPKI